MKTALIAGASGLIGQSLLQQLLQSDQYNNVIALVRRPSLDKQPKLEEVVLDFEQINRFQTDLKVDDVFCCLGTTIKSAGSQEAFTKVDHTYVFELARWAQDHQCRLFSVISSVGAAPSTSNFYLRTKGQMETDVMALKIPSIHIFRPSLLLGQRKEFRLAEKLSEKLMRVINPLLCGSFRKYRAIRAEAVAQAMYNRAQSQSDGTSIYEGAEIR
jgi:uncharacterized protein YbjT (DUF2867 family)